MSDNARWPRGPSSASTSHFVVRCNISEAAHVRRLLARAPLSGVWQLAGVLADGVLHRQSAAALARVCAPKAHGAWSLHIMTASTPLQTCALFSSAAAVLGGAGQANYSAANARLDALAACRRTRGCAAVSVQWGAWTEVGMAARSVTNAAANEILTIAGFGRISLSQGISALHVAVLPRAPSSFCVVPLRHWCQMLGGAVPALLSSIASPRSDLRRSTDTRSQKQEAWSWKPGARS